MQSLLNCLLLSMYSDSHQYIHEIAPATETTVKGNHSLDYVQSPIWRSNNCPNGEDVDCYYPEAKTM